MGLAKKSALTFALVAVFALIFIPIGWLLLSAFESSVVLYQAKRIAGGRPYCIVVSDKDHPMQYKEVTQEEQLSYSNMTTRLSWGGSSGPFVESYYALLILQNPEDVRNWSKISLNFKDDVDLMQSSLYRRKIGKLCSPAVNFIDRLRR
jgi:ABC-type glycerol-3-phosphate transport system permease component